MMFEKSDTVPNACSMLPGIWSMFTTNSVSAYNAFDYSQPGNPRMNFKHYTDSGGVSWKISLSLFIKDQSHFFQKLMTNLWFPILKRSQIVCWRWPDTWLALYKRRQRLIWRSNVARISIHVETLKDLGADLLKPFSGDVCIEPLGQLQEVFSFLWQRARPRLELD